jgi:hypothetical protein
MTLGTILLIVLLLLLVGAVPSWPRSRGWGYGPSGGIGLVLAIRACAAAHRPTLIADSRPNPERLPAHTHTR